MTVLPVPKPSVDLDSAVAQPVDGGGSSRAVMTPLWAAQYRIALVTLDICAIVIAVVIGYLLRFGSLDVAQQRAQAGSYLAIGAVIVAVWLVAMQYSGGYELRHLATGPEEAKRVLRASAATLSVVAITCYSFKFALARGFVIGVIPLGVLLLLLVRHGVRRFVARRRRHGEWMRRIVAVGTADSVGELIAVTERARSAGLAVIGACVEDREVGSELGNGVPVLGGVRAAADCAARVNADVIAIANNGVGPTTVRELGWQLEGSGRGLVLAPALTEIAGTRVHVSPVEGLPLVWLDQPGLARVPRLTKRVMDVTIASAALLAVSPLLIVTAVVIKCTSSGPVFFRQRRLGINGTEFRIMKFRTMFTGSEAKRAELLEMNEQDGGGVLFKIREDPRITPIGRWLRRLSIDELPQLLHVISGTMALVGPRPLAAEDSTYTGHARRRLLVRPGITGLWQISGRSDLSWEDAVRLDLYYVENWSIALDVSILARTALAVVGKRGAY